jgi:signal transduction histidine kinase
MSLPTLREVTSVSAGIKNMRNALVDAELIDSVNQLIRLRWLAGIGVLFVTLIAGPFFNVTAPTGLLLTVGVFILLYNLVFWAINHRLPRAVTSVDAYQKLAIGQMILDWIAMILLIHFSGGIESPTIYFFLFHLIIASILFPPGIAYTLAVIALVLFFTIVFLEYFSIIPHYALVGFLDRPLYQNVNFVIGVSLFFGSTAVFITYLVTNISDRLRRREIEVVELSKNLERATNRLQALNESARIINSTLKLNQVLDLVVKNTVDVMGVRACSLRLLDKSGQQLETVAMHGLSQEYIEKGPIVLVNSPLERRVLGGEIVNIPDVTQSSLLQYPEWAVSEGVFSMLSAPLIGKNKTLGTLRAYSVEKNHFTFEDENFLTAIAAQGSIAIENAIAYEVIESLEATKSTFVRTFTHELRSPVGVIRSLLRNITDGYTGDITSQQRDILDRAIRRTDFLRELIDDLLDLSAGKVQDRSAIESEPVSVNEILEKVIDRFEIPAHEKEIQLDLKNKGDDQQIRVMANPEGLDRIFNNLMSNAIKYTPQKGKVTITLTSVGKEVHVAVEDTGIGIPEDAIPHLFNEFYRAPNAKKTEGQGTGLGLSIVKNTVALYGGSVKVESKLGVGTCFTVILDEAVK